MRRADEFGGGMAGEGGSDDRRVRRRDDRRVRGETTGELGGDDRRGAVMRA